MLQGLDQLVLAALCRIGSVIVAVGLVLFEDVIDQVGMARHYKEYSDRCPNGSEFLADAENEAKSKQVGLWLLNNE